MSILWERSPIWEMVIRLYERVSVKWWLNEMGIYTLDCQNNRMGIPGADPGFIVKGTNPLGGGVNPYYELQKCLKNSKEFQKLYFIRVRLKIVYFGLNFKCSKFVDSPPTAVKEHENRCCYFGLFKSKRTSSVQKIWVLFSLMPYLKCLIIKIDIKAFYWLILANITIQAATTSCLSTRLVRTFLWLSKSRLHLNF